MLYTDEQFREQRQRMVEDQIVRRGVNDSCVVEAMRSIERHRFVLTQDRGGAYDDLPLPIGFGQTISQPYIVAYMAQELHLKPSDRILEIGTGSGYAAAVVAHCAKTVYTLEIVKELYERSSKLFRMLGYDSIVGMLGDGFEGLPREAPFDKIMLTAAPDHVPQTLLDQLKIGGRLLAPIGSLRFMQRLIAIDKLSADRYKETELMGVAFVEMLRKYS